MDITTLLGLVICFVLVIFGISTGPESWAGLGHFADVPSVIITLGGSAMCMFTQAKGIPEFLASYKSIGLAFKKPTANEAQVIGDIVKLSNVARKEGLLALEEMANNLEDEFLKKGIMLIVDGTDPELVRGIMEADLILSWSVILWRQSLLPWISATMRKLVSGRITAAWVLHGV